MIVVDENHHPNSFASQTFTEKRENTTTRASLPTPTPAASRNRIPLKPSASKQGKLNANVINPVFDPKRPQPWDLVMVIAANIHHPAIEYATIYSSYTLFGMVRLFTYVKWSSKDGREEWNNYGNNHKRLDIEWEPAVSHTHTQRWIDDTMADKKNQNHAKSGQTYLWRFHQPITRRSTSSAKRTIVI